MDRGPAETRNCQRMTKTQEGKTREDDKVFPTDRARVKKGGKETPRTDCNASRERLRKNEVKGNTRRQQGVPDK